MIAFRRFAGFIAAGLFVLSTFAQAQATVDFLRIELRWPEIDLVFVTNCDGVIVHPQDSTDVHVLDNGVARTVVALRTDGDATVATILGGCPGGQSSRVYLSVTLPCGTTAAVNKDYRAPYDPMAFRMLRVRPDEVPLPAGRTIQLPVRLLDPALGTHQTGYRVRIGIDTAVARPVGVYAGAGTLLEGAAVTFTRWPSPELQFSFPASAFAADTGVLCTLELQVLPRGDTACTDLRLLPQPPYEDPLNCTRMQYVDATLCAAPPSPELVCEGASGPDTLRWNAATGRYLPDPYIFKAVVRNTGNDDARSPVFRLLWTPEDLVLRPGFRDTVLGSPTRVSPGSICQTEWRFDVPEKQAAAHVTRVEAVVEYLGGAPVICGRDVVLLRDPVPVLSCTAQAATVAWNDVLQRYVPMPFPLTVDVMNSGEGRSDTVFVEVVLPPELTLPRGESAIKRISPAVLLPLAGGGAEWQLVHGRTEMEKSYEVTVRTWTASTAVTECRTTVTIPAAPAGPFAYTLAASGPLAFCEGDSVTLDGGAGHVSWLWSTGDTVRSITATASGAYWCEARDAAGRTGLSDTVLVTVWPLPPAPVILREHDVLRVAGAAGLRLQWYRDGWPLAGETADTLRLMDTGTYAVRVSTEEGCASESAPLEILVLSADDGAAARGFRLRAWPEPARDALTVDIEVPAGQAATLRLVDLLGRSELLYDGVPANGRLRLPLSLGTRSRGVLLLVLRSGQTQLLKRVTRL